jgi:hypothetical protein
MFRLLPADKRRLPRGFQALKSAGEPYSMLYAGAAGDYLEFLMAACAAAIRAMGTRKGEQET